MHVLFVDCTCTYGIRTLYKTKFCLCGVSSIQAPQHHMVARDDCSEQEKTFLFIDENYAFDDDVLSHKNANIFSNSILERE